jgi:hypothetical protein
MVRKSFLTRVSDLSAVGKSLNMVTTTRLPNQRNNWLFSRAEFVSSECRLRRFSMSQARDTMS